MAASLNRAFLIGNLTRDPELRYVPSGQAVATFSVAVNRVYTTQAGEKKEEVSFINIVVWGRRAEVCGEYLSKGSPVFIEGRLQSRSWEDQNGQKRYALEVIAQSVQFLRPAPRGTTAVQAPPSEEIESIDLESDAPSPPKPVEKQVAPENEFRGTFGDTQARSDAGKKDAAGTGGDEVPF